jgi:hypothetical protein
MGEGEGGAKVTPEQARTILIDNCDGYPGHYLDIADGFDALLAERRTSGCVCRIDDDGNYILSRCNLHMEDFQRAKDAERERERLREFRNLVMNAIDSHSIANRASTKRDWIGAIIAMDAALAAPADAAPTTAEYANAGDARCGYCDGPMPCRCPAAPELLPARSDVRGLTQRTPSADNGDYVVTQSRNEEITDRPSGDPQPGTFLEDAVDARRWRMHLEVMADPEGYGYLTELWFNAMPEEYEAAIDRCLARQASGTVGGSSPK